MADAPAPSTLIERVRERLEATELNPYSASMRAELGPDFVRNILRGRIKNPSAEKLTKLARVLDCSIHYLLGVEDIAPSPIEGVEVLFSPTEDTKPADSPLALLLPIRFELSAAHHRPAQQVTRVARSFEVAPNLAAYAGKDQWYEVLTDNSMSEVAPANSFAHVVEFHDAEREKLAHGDLVIVQRRYFSNRTGQHTLHRSMRYVNFRYPELGLWFLDYNSKEPDFPNETDDILREDPRPPKDKPQRTATPRTGEHDSEKLEAMLAEVDRLLATVASERQGEAFELWRTTKAQVVAKVLRLILPVDDRAGLGSYGVSK